MSDEVDTSGMSDATSLVSKRPAAPKGFTLVEILIVLVILGVVATVTVFAIRGITDRGEQSACDTDNRTMESAVAFYLSTNGITQIPPTGDPLDPDRFEQTLVDAELLASVSSSHDVAADGSVTAVDVPCP